MAVGPVNTTQRVAALRAIMHAKGIHAYLIPSEDAHQSEYIAPCDARRAFISGFTGSAGFAVVTVSDAALWTDGRYFLQASLQLGPGWRLMKAGLPETPSREAWLTSVLPAGSRVGIDPKLITISAAKVLTEELGKHGLSVMSLGEENLVDLVWERRPAMPMEPVSVLPVSYSGHTWQDKVTQLQATIKARKACWGFVVTALDDIAWLFNLRGSDIDFNPVFFAHALITVDTVTLYMDAAKLSPPVLEHLSGVTAIKPYAQIFQDLAGAGAQHEPSKLWLDTRCSLALQEVVGGAAFVYEAPSPIMLAKAIKNETEMEGFRACHIRDAAALCNYFAWLEDELLVKGNRTISEADGADRLEKFRSEMKDFVGPSFDTISSTGPNGAIIHYKPEKGSCSMIVPEQMYLCDSGGQYKDGTTDVTRTIHFGQPSAFEREAFTRVLKGHIQIDLARFPKGTSGYNLDTLARAALWKVGLNYNHGTGHGVGHFLNVHEGPQGISTRIAHNATELQVGMTLSNEPGYYHDGAFGIRIENIVLVQPAPTPYQFGGVSYLGFEHVTLVPIQTKLVVRELLTPEEVEWLNAYHEECWRKVSPLLQSEDGLGCLWLHRETRPI